ncbi:MAG: Verru_Chthon cassette protein C [Verrucomicrobiota bacterium]
MKNHPRFSLSSRQASGFTLVEIMVSLAVLTILLLISAQVIGQVQSTWSASNARTTQFKEARTAFDILSRNISQATLNTYIDYDTNYLATAGGGAAAAAAPSNYIRKSDLHFQTGKASTLVPAGGGGSFTPGHAVFFQAPLGISNDPTLVGLDRLLCARGYFVQFSSDASWVPDFIPSQDFRYRYRLMEYSPPTEQNSIYAANHANNGVIAPTWFAAAGGAANAASNTIPTTRPVADNIVALIISPRREPLSDDEQESATGPTQIAQNYAYDSSQPGNTQHLLPPLVRIVLIAIDEKSSVRMEELTGSKSTPPLGDEITPIISNAHELDQEVKEIVALLQTRRLNYRVFSATVTLRGSKWSA